MNNGRKGAWIEYPRSWTCSEDGPCNVKLRGRIGFSVWDERHYSKGGLRGGTDSIGPGTMAGSFIRAGSAETNSERAAGSVAGMGTGSVGTGSVVTHSVGEAGPVARLASMTGKTVL